MKTAMEHILRGTRDDVVTALAAVGLDFSPVDGAERSVVFDGATRVDMHVIKNLVVDPGEVILDTEGNVVAVIRANVTDGPHVRVQFWGEKPALAASRLADRWNGTTVTDAPRKSHDIGLKVRTRDGVSLYLRRPAFLGYVTRT